MRGLCHAILRRKHRYAIAIAHLASRRRDSQLGSILK